MSHPVTFHRLAELELYETAQYYELKRAGLGAAFLDEVERCIAAIAENPDLGTIVRADVRRRLVARFPYGVLYSKSGPDIRVLAIMNLRRRPSYWVGRS